MKRILLITFLSVFIFKVYGQDNIGTPYSVYGIGLQTENAGPYNAMGGVAAAMRDNGNINYLNPASYTALDTARLYFQFGVTGEYAHLSTYKENASYRVAQNTAFNIAFRLYKNMYMSLGFTEKSDIGYDLLYTNIIPGSTNSYFTQNIQGEGGLNDVYLGLGWRYKNLSIGLNTSLIFGKIEKRQTLTAMLEGSKIIKTSENNRIHDVLFTPGIQYTLNLSPKSILTLGSAFNFTQKLRSKTDYMAYCVNSSTNTTEMLNDLTLKRGYIKYPFRILSGFDFRYNRKWDIAGDYTFQKMSVYEEFGKNQELKDYHKAALGLSWTPERLGHYWWQRNSYMLGGYFIHSGIDVKNVDINTYAITFGSQIPFYTARNGILLLGVAFDLGIRGTEQNGLIQEKFAKVRINIGFNEFWFMKRKIN